MRLDPATGRYRQIPADAAGRYPSPALGLEVGLAKVAPFPDPILALFEDGELVEPEAQLVARLQQTLSAVTDEVLRERAAKERERAAKERERAAKERERAEKEQALARAEQLEAELRELKRRFDA